VSLGAISSIEARVAEAVKPVVEEAWAKGRRPGQAHRRRGQPLSFRSGTRRWEAFPLKLHLWFSFVQTQCLSLARN